MRFKLSVKLCDAHLNNASHSFLTLSLQIETTPFRMIGLLDGQILEKTDAELILGIGSESTGMVGYKIKTPASSRYLDLSLGDRARFYIYTHVKEDAFDLYGFTSEIEKSLFLQVTSINGIGPKAGLALISLGSPEQFVSAVINEDKAYLSQASGVGKKTVERIVLELKDPIKKKIESGEYSQSKGLPKVSRDFSSVNDAKIALLSLGYKESDIKKTLEQIVNEFETPPPVELMIKTALQNL